MDLDFTQVGQNFADINTPSRSFNNAGLPEQKTVSPDVEMSLDKSKDISLSADNLNEQQNSDALEETVDEALTHINDFVQSKNRQLNFSVDEDSGRQVIKVTDAGSGDVIRQIPTPEVLKLSARIQELQSDLGSAVGLFFDNQA
ncbi:MAG: flagellar protein FlaG [Paraglaciecola sp.]|jgi:flagellar protein FlaG